MALIKCKECGKEYSTDAKACPNCGKRRTTERTKLIAILFALIIIGSIWESMKKNEAEMTRQAALTPEQRVAEAAAQAKVNRLRDARYACKHALKEVLNDPDSAKLEETLRWYAEERKDGTILVQPTGRAKNAFGAYIHGVWDCVAKLQGGSARVLSLKQIRP